MPLSRDELWNQVNRGQLSPVYVLFGEETNLRDLAVKTIAERAFDEGDFRDFNISEFTLSGDDSVKDALAAAEQLPMMSARRVILIKNVRVSQSGRGDTIKEDHESLLANYFARPAETSVVVFIAEELNGVRKVGKFLKSSDGAVEFRQLDDGALAQRAAKQFVDAGVAIDRATVDYLISIVGPDTSRLFNEVNKLIAASFPHRVVTIELIDSLVSNTRALDNWALTNQINADRKREALEVLAKVLDDGAEPVMIVGMLGSNYRKMLMAADLMGRGVDRREVEKATGVRGFALESFLRASRQVGASRLAVGIRQIADADLAIKTSVGGSGTAGPRMQIEKLVCELVSL